MTPTQQASLEIIGGTVGVIVGLALLITGTIFFPIVVGSLIGVILLGYFLFVFGSIFREMIEERAKRIAQSTSLAPTVSALVFDKETRRVGCAITQAAYVGDHDSFILAAFDDWQTTILPENAVVFNGTPEEWLERAAQHNALQALRSGDGNS